MNMNAMLKILVNHMPINDAMIEILATLVRINDAVVAIDALITVAKSSLWEEEDGFKDFPNYERAFQALHSAYLVVMSACSHLTPDCNSAFGHLACIIEAFGTEMSNFFDPSIGLDPDVWPLKFPTGLPNITNYLLPNLRTSLHATAAFLCVGSSFV